MKQADSVLVVGADGMIGRALAQRFVAEGRRVFRTTLRPAPGAASLDLARDVSAWTPPRASVAYLCAAITSQDQCRAHCAESRTVNVDGTLALAEKLVRQGTHVVFPSTNLVLDGLSPHQPANAPYSPQTEYGRQKAEVEQCLRQLPGTCVVRFAKVFGRATPLLLRWIAELRMGKTIRPFSDLPLAPVPLDFAVETLAAVASARAEGIVQVSANKDVTYAAAARFIADALRVPLKLVEPVTVAESGMAIEYVPAYTTLDTTRLHSEFGLTPPPLWAAITLGVEVMRSQSVPLVSYESQMACHLCGAAGLKEFTAFGAFRRITSDCRPWPAGGRLCACPSCGSVQKLVDDRWKREVEELYSGYAIYDQAGGAEQAVFDQSSGAASSRSQRLLTALGDAFQLPAHGRMLDVGCGNGAMLRAFSKAVPGWSLVGTELSDKYRLHVESIPGVESLYTCPAEEVPGQFDVISLIHVLEHISEPAAFLNRLLSKLRPGGLLVVELPHHVANPFELLIADHCTHFSSATATALLTRSGLDVVSIADNWVPKELTLVARRPVSPLSAMEAPLSPADSAEYWLATAEYWINDLARTWDAPKGNSPQSPSLLEGMRSLRGAQRSDGSNGRQSHQEVVQSYLAGVECRVAWLDQILAMARKLASQREIGLFGTSIAATWLFTELEGAVSFFVDEDPQRVGKHWQGRPVCHPSQIPSGSCLMIPLPFALAVGISRRIARPDIEICLPPEIDGSSPRRFAGRQGRAAPAAPIYRGGLPSGSGPSVADMRSTDRPGTTGMFS